MTSKARILVTGATGKTGGAVARQLLQKGYPVNALVRRQDHRADALAKAGAQVFIGDLLEPEDLRSAMADAQRAYFLAPWAPNQLHGAMNFAVAAADAHLEVVVTLTHWLAQPQHPSVATRQSYLTDRVFDWMPGVDTISVNPGWFADNYMEVLGTVAQLGIFPYPLGDGKTAPVSNEDVARVAVGALVNPGPHIGKYYRPSGPELLAPHQLAATFGKVLGRSVTYQDMSPRMFLKALKVSGMSPFLMNQLQYYLEEYRRGGFAAGAPNDVVQRVGGSAPEDFETITRRYVAANPMTRRSLANKLRAIAEFGKIVLARTPDLAAYERTQNHPLLKDPKYGLDYEPWRRSHTVPNAYGLEGVFNQGHLQLSGGVPSVTEDSMVAVG
jgi:uncharacterized protein YbjT (DUF2867 family)